MDGNFEDKVKGTVHEAEAKLRPAFDRLPDQEQTVGFFKRLWAHVVSFFNSLRGV